MHGVTYKIHYDPQAHPSSDRPDSPTWGKDPICGVPGRIDRNARYYATTEPAAVTCKRCVALLKGRTND